MSRRKGNEDCLQFNEIKQPKSGHQLKALLQEAVYVTERDFAVLTDLRLIKLLTLVCCSTIIHNSYRSYQLQSHKYCLQCYSKLMILSGLYVIKISGISQYILQYHE